MALQINQQGCVVQQVDFAQKFNHPLETGNTLKLKYFLFVFQQNIPN
jgi:hypothetical protein